MFAPRPITVVFAAVGLAGMAWLAGCEESSAPTQTGSNPIGNLREDPQSLAGRSAATGRDAARQAANRDAAIGNLASQIAGGEGRVNVAGLTWQLPDGWSTTPPSGAMRAAEVNVPGPSGNATITFITFGPGQGGDVSLNIDRWAGQVRGPGGSEADHRSEERTIAGVPVTTFASEGTFMDGMPGQPATPRAGWAVRGAIVEGPSGMVFIKMTGPAGTVAQADSDWNRLINSMTAGG